ncbi:MAG: bifunctional glutamate N-acetyltransferase/amino-acid acetyltransferase ArgJ [Thermoleophilia bacterium]
MGPDAEKHSVGKGVAQDAGLSARGAADTAARHPVVSAPASSTFLHLPKGSRWVEGTDGQVGATFAHGFEAAGVACGLKESGREDLGLLRVAPRWGDLTVSAAVFTRNAFAAAPVRVCRRRTKLDGLHGLVINSGNANAATGPEGLRVALAGRDRAAAALGIRPERTGVASTGVIGVPLPELPYLEGIRLASASLDPGGGEDFARALMTTDRFPKVAQLEVTLPEGRVRLGAAAKGAGMIAPSMATMLCVVTTDAVLDVELASSALTGAVSRTFNRISVDGEMSTNDSVFFLAGGASGVAPREPQSRRQLAEALEVLLLRLALMMVADGEGATKVACIDVSGGPSQMAADAAAWAVANSLLVKTALNGQDPNWGRVLSAAGAALAGADFPRARLSLGGITVFSDGSAESLGKDETARLEQLMRRAEISFALDLGAGAHRARAYFSDIGHEYVSINADYHT